MLLLTISEIRNCSSVGCLKCVQFYNWFQTKLHDPKFKYHFIRFILKSHNLITAYSVNSKPTRSWSVQIFIESSCKSANKWLFGDWLVKKVLKSDWLFCFTVPFSLAEKRWDLEQKIVRFVNKSYC